MLFKIKNSGKKFSSILCHVQQTPKKQKNSNFAFKND